MKIFCWSLRGLNDLSRQGSLTQWITAKRPSLGGILETHVQEDNADEILARILPGWRREYNYSVEADNGRI